MKSRNILCATICLIVFNLPAISQVSTDHSLYGEIMKLDSLLFDQGFNNCNYEALSEITAIDLEFYHDQGGITFGKKEFINSIRKNICSIDYKPIRKLKPGTSEIFPLYDAGKLYGTIQSGVHEFYAKEEGKEPYLTSVAKFTNLWLKKDEKWILKRVLSFDHRSPESGK